MQSYILSEKWAIASADAKRLLRASCSLFRRDISPDIRTTHLAEEDFTLKDAVGERKYNVDLARALRLSKKNKGKMLRGHTFYVTPRVSIDTKLLKNVVNACGGQVCPFCPVSPPSTETSFNLGDDAITYPADYQHLA